MAAWFAQNAGTILVLFILLAVVGAAVRSIVKKHRSGKSPCGCDCGCCGSKGVCHGGGKTV